MPFPGRMVRVSGFGQTGPRAKEPSFGMIGEALGGIRYLTGYPPEVTDPKRTAGGWIPRLGVPKEMPGWLTEEELDYYVMQFERL